MIDKDLAELQEQIATILSRVKRPKKAVVTAGMPYANGPVHIGHLAGTHIPADIYSRWLKLLIGSENVLFVCGTDDHGSNSEVAAKTKGITTKEFINDVHSAQNETMKKYNIQMDTYTGTSREENYEDHVQICQDMLRNLHKNNMLEKKTTDQWFDTELNMFLPDRFVYGTCPNQSCENKKAYSDECDDCGKVYPPKNLIDPKSTVSDATPVLRPTAHWWLNMWKVSDQLREWIATKQKTWRKVVYLETYNTVLPSVQFSNKFEEVFKGLKEKLPTFKSRYAPGKMIVAQFSSLSDLEQGFKTLKENGIESEYVDGWAHRSITRDVSNGVPVPPEIDEEMKGKTFYVWPESLVAPISFTRVALKKQGKDPELYKDFWTDPESKVYQFLGQDNIYFYVLMQGAMWFGSQEDPMRQPVKGELQLTDVFGNYHLQVDGDKMSKTKGNFYTGDQLLDEHGYSADQIRYFLAILSLSEKNSNFDFEVLKERNKFLAGPLNASFEKPISACLSKFDGVIPEGKLIGKTKKETYKVIQTYVKLMEKADYAKLLFMVENYARVINSLFAQYKPHDDRHDETERKDALFSCFFILKNIMIMLSPFAPDTMESLRQSLNLPESILSIDELGKPMSTNHKISEQKDFFPGVDS
tara:strand:- start:126878 stop:128803 length:1926 start_codon:yes stop_codon:yes gene_type:complete